MHLWFVLKDNIKIYIKIYMNHYPANVENMVSSSYCQQMADGI